MSKLSSRVRQYAKRIDRWLGQFPGFTPHGKTHYRAARPIVGPVHTQRGLATMGTFANVERIDPVNLKKAYKSTPALVIEYRADNFSRHMAGIKVERRVGQGSFEEVEMNHPWIPLLRRPNKHLAPGVFWKLHYQILDYVGEVFYLVERGRVELEGGVTVRLPTQLHTIYPDFGDMYPVFGSVGEIVAWWFHRADGNQTLLSAKDVIRVYRPHPANPEQPESLIDRMYGQIQSKQLADAYGKTSNENLGRPDVMLELDDIADEEEIARLSELFFEQYSAGARSGVPVSAGGLKIKEIELTNRDRQFQESREFDEDLIFMLAGVPKSQFTDQANRANTEGTFKSFAMNIVLPNVSSTASQLEFAFERIFGTDPDELRLALPADIVPQDPEQVARVDKLEIEAGVSLINEVRERKGREPVEGGDVPRASAALSPLEREPIPTEF